MFIRVKNNLALTRFHYHGYDLLLEVAFINRVGCALMGSQGQLVLLLAGNAIFLGHVFSRDAHMHFFEGVRQGAGQHVLHDAVTHSCPEPVCRRNIRRSAHVFDATGDRDTGIAKQQRLSS